MKLITLLILTLTLQAFANESNWHLPYCENCTTPNAEEKQVSNIILTLGNLVKEADAMEAASQQKIHEWADFNRWLKKMPTKTYTQADKKMP